jgi:hypothetical protein
MGAQGGGAVAGIPFPRRRFAGVGRSRSFRLGFGWGLAREVEHDTTNSSRHSRRLIRVWVGAHHSGGGTGSRQRGDLARVEEKGKGKWARRAPYHPRKLRRRLEVKNWRRRGRITAAQGRSMAAQPSVRAMARRCKGSGKAGNAKVA